VLFFQVGAGCATRIGELRNAYKILLGKPEGSKSLRRSKRRWENNKKMYCKEIGREDVWDGFV
jgi:hypothetical protein